MVLLDNELNRIRNLFNDDVSTGLLGTGTVTEAATDTGLLFPDATSESAVTKEIADKQATYTYELNSVAAVGTTFGEFGLKTGVGTTVNRVTFFPLTKELNEEWNFETTIFFTQS